MAHNDRADSNTDKRPTLLPQIAQQELVSLEVAPRFSTLASATFVVIVFGLGFLPLAEATPLSSHAFVDRLVGECAADIAAVQLQTQLFFDEQASLPVSSFVTGSRLVLERAEGTDARIYSEPVSPGAWYSNYNSHVVETRTYGEFKIDLADFDDGAKVTILPQVGASPGWSSAVAPAGFDVAIPVGGAELRNDDPRLAFYELPPAPTLSAGLQNLAIGGDLRLLVEQTTFTVTHPGGVHGFRSHESERLGVGASAKQIVYYVLHVEGARLVLNSYPIAARVFANILDLECDGSIFDGSANGQADTGESHSPIASGLLQVRPRLTQENALDVAFTQLERPSPMAATNAASVAQSAFSFWTIFAVLGLVASGGAAGWRLRRAPATTSSTASRIAPTPSATAPRPGPRDIPQLEVAYRADAGNAVLALELGLAYAKQKRPHDAVPLLQLAVQAYPKMDAARYFCGVALLDLGRVDDGLRHLSYSFRLNALNVARFINEGPVHVHGQNPRVRAMLARWSRHFQESSSRGYV